MLRRGLAIVLQLLLVQLVMLGGRDCTLPAASAPTSSSLHHGEHMAPVHADVHADAQVDVHAHHAAPDANTTGDGTQPTAPAQCVMAASCSSVVIAASSIDFETSVVQGERVAHADDSRPLSTSRAPEPPPPRG